MRRRYAWFAATVLLAVATTAACGSNLDDGAEVTMADGAARLETIHEIMLTMAGKSELRLEPHSTSR